MFRRAKAGQFVGFAMVDRTGAAAPGLTVTVYRVIDNGDQHAATGTVEDKGYGQYSFVMSSADCDGLQISFLFLADGAVPTEKTVVTDGDVVNDVFGSTFIPLTETSQIVDENGNRLAAITLRQALKLLLAGLCGNRTGVGTGTVAAAMTGMDNVAIEAVRASQEAVESSWTVPAETL